MDVRHLEFEDNSFEIAIDKGTLDAMLHGSLWDPPDDVRENVGNYVDEVLYTETCAPGVGNGSLTGTLSRLQESSNQEVSGCT